MSCLLDNRTPFPARLQPMTSSQGHRQWLLTVKATWVLDSGRLASAEQQQAIRIEPHVCRVGDLALDDVQRRCLGPLQDEELVWVDAETGPPKPSFNLLVSGHACAPAGWNQPQLSARVQVGGIDASLTAHVPRCWVSGLLGMKSRSLAAVVSRVPLHPAFGDWDGGLLAGAVANGLPLLPWLQHTKHAARYQRRAVVPAGWGPWPPNAAHRHCHAGTYDEAWQRERAPQLPKDFDPRHWNDAHPELQASKPPTAGEVLRLQHLGSQPLIESRMPGLPLSAAPRQAGGQQLPSMALLPDTLLIEPDHNRMSLLWRQAFNQGDGASALTSIQLFKTPAGSHA